MTTTAKRSHDHESFAETSSRLKELVDKSGQIILWDACKALGWSADKGGVVAEKMAALGEVFITKRQRNGRSVRVLSSKPLEEQTRLDDWATGEKSDNRESAIRDAQIEMQNAIINATIDLTVQDFKDFIENYFDLAKLPPDRLKRLMGTHIGTMILDAAAKSKSVGFEKGIFDDRLKRVLARDGK